jgi:hypothetical protein
MANHGLFDPGGVLRQGVDHPLASSGFMLNNIPFKFTPVQRQNRLDLEFKESIVNARTGLTREPGRLYGFVDPALGGR